MNRYQRENPSFSSTLLDSIYRSIDESNGKGEEELILYRETMRKKQNNGNGLKDEGSINREERKTSLKKACMIEKWMEEKVSYETRRKSFNHPVLLNSSSSSSESSCGGGFSSSESESRSSSTNYTMQRPKPIRTSVSEVGKYNNNNNNNNNKHEGSFVKTKSKALKIYGDLKKVKQPISPGGRLASFINSLFTARNNEKKSKINMSEQQPSTCSSASSFSRSCLSKTPSSRGNNGAKRSVRFYPVSVIVDEDGHKSLYTTTTTTTDTTNQDLKFHVMNETRRVEEVARDLLKNYQNKKQQDFDFDFDFPRYSSHQQPDQDDMDDDAASYASSDLFELDNIGIERYREELPVYETTHLRTNRAIANGLIL